MVALIVTDALGRGETKNRLDPLVKWICQDYPIQRESVVRIWFLAYQRQPTPMLQFPPAPAPLRPEDGYVFAQIEQCLVSFCTRADSRHTTIRKIFP
jgi:hypothetical protein